MWLLGKVVDCFLFGVLLLFIFDGVFCLGFLEWGMFRLRFCLFVLFQQPGSPSYSGRLLMLDF